MFLRNIGRFIIYPWFRKSVIREISIKKIQKRSLIGNYNPYSKNLIVFVIDGADPKTGLENKSGGILSIASIFEETLKLYDIHLSEVLMCTRKDSRATFCQFSFFKSDINIYTFDQVMQFFVKPKNITFHILCYLAPKFHEHLENYKNKLRNLDLLHINIFNQSIHLMPEPIELKKLFTWTNHITQTTAHKRYSTREIQQKYGFPLHHLSVFASPENYTFKEYNEKKDILVISPDPHNCKENIIRKIKDNFKFEFITIANMSYEEYLEIIANTRFTITFGEGLDFYFVDTIFSGGVSFAVYNSFFFPSDFRGKNGLFESFESFESNIVIEIKKLLTYPNKYKEYNLEQYNLCHKYYDYKKYKENIKNFYLRNYTFS